jgi:hypothetical protein
LASLLPEKTIPMDKKMTIVKYRILCALSNGTQVELEVAKTLEEAILRVEKIKSKFRSVGELIIYEVTITESAKIVYRDQT